MRRTPLLVVVGAALVGLSVGANYDDICGKEDVKGVPDWWKMMQDMDYIVGGLDSSTEELPWMVSLRNRTGEARVSGHFCGGSIVSATAVVTAAHCVQTHSATPVVVYYKDKNDGASIKLVKRIVVHPQYNPLTVDYDIAVIELEGKGFDFDDVESHLRPICLPKAGDDIYEWPACLVAGWGVTQFGAKRGSPNLLKTDVDIVDRASCFKAYSALRTPITRRMFCAGDYKAGGKSTCQGDSGGPLMCLRDDHRYQLGGVTSFGFQCGRPGFPAVFVDVEKVLSFIKEIANVD